MSDPSDPTSWSPAGIVTAVLAGLAALAGAIASAFRGTSRSEREEAREERQEVRAALTALREAFEELRVIVQRSDKDLALIAHTLGEKSARNDRMEKRVDELEAKLIDLELEFARSRGFDSGIRKAP